MTITLGLRTNLRFRLFAVGSTNTHLLDFSLHTNVLHNYDESSEVNYSGNNTYWTCLHTAYACYSKLVITVVSMSSLNSTSGRRVLVPKCVRCYATENLYYYIQWLNKVPEMHRSEHRNTAYKNVLLSPVWKANKCIFFFFSSIIFSSSDYKNINTKTRSPSLIKLNSLAQSTNSKGINLHS